METQLVNLAYYTAEQQDDANLGDGDPVVMAQWDRNGG
jgi:hypothetical protein